MVDIQTVSIVVASASVTVAAFYYIWQIRHQTRIRKTDILIRLYSMFQTSEYQKAWRQVLSSQFKDYEDYAEKYGKISSEAGIPWTLVLSPYEMVGTLLFRKQIDIRSVYDMLGTGAVKMLYEKFKPVMAEARKEFDDPALFIGFEYIHDEFVKKEPQLRKTLGKYGSQHS